MKVAKTESFEDLSSLYDLEYRAKEDDAWYSVYVLLHAPEQKMIIKYMCSPQEYEAVIYAGDFQTPAELDEFVRRFRPVSGQLQDHQCHQLVVGTTVCAANGTGDNDLRFYDAVIEAVNHQPHSFSDGEEVCLCNFVLFWEHGPRCGTLTSVNIACICILKPVTQVDPRVSAFAKFAKEKITSSKSISISDSNASSSKGPLSGKGLLASQNGHQETETSMVLKSRSWRNEDSEMISNYNHCKSTSVDSHFILVDNLEKDLNPTSIKEFIHKQTSILPQAVIFPRALSDPFQRGAILVDGQKKFQTMYDFLENPNHLIVSSKGRPWVITGKALVGTFDTTSWNLIPMTLDKTKNKTTGEELEIVHSGTESYKRAKQLRDLFADFIHHESLLCKRLVLEEKRIFQSFQPA